MSAKDKVVPVDENVSVTFVPVADYGTTFKASAEDIVSSLGTRIGKVKKESDVPPKHWEGHVPPSNRDGETAKEDPQLGHTKQQLMRELDAVQDNSIASGSLDPRDNPKAPDKH